MVVHVLPIATQKARCPKSAQNCHALPGQLAIGLGIGGTSAARTLQAMPFSVRTKTCQGQNSPDSAATRKAPKLAQVGLHGLAN